jgi:hypothetical protein
LDELAALRVQVDYTCAAPAAKNGRPRGQRRAKAGPRSKAQPLTFVKILDLSDQGRQFTITFDNDPEPDVTSDNELPQSCGGSRGPTATVQCTNLSGCNAVRFFIDGQQVAQLNANQSSACFETPASATQASLVRVEFTCPPGRADSVPCFLLADKTFLIQFSIQDNTGTVGCVGPNATLNCP